MKIQIVSDLHIDFYPIELPGGEFLVIAGDYLEFSSISKYTFEGKKNLRFNKKILTNFEKNLYRYDRVLYVLGNHEHYHWNVKTTKESFENLFQDLGISNTQILENDCVEIEGKLFIGCTYWTDFDSSNWFVMNYCQNNMSDYNVCEYGSYKFKPQHSLALHDKSKHFIKQVCEQNKNKEIVLITHMAPSTQSIHEKYKDSMLNGAFASADEDLFLDNGNIKLAIHGHTHTSFDYVINNTRIVCNPRGYSNGHYTENGEFSKAFEVEI